MKKLFQDDNVNTTVINIGLLRLFGPECYAWEPETIRSEIKQMFNVELSKG